MSLKIGVVVFPGSCDDRDALAAIARLGDARPVELWHADRDLRGVDAVVVPGGFSYGDYLRAGAIARFAPAMESVRDFALSGGPVLGICNGFQILCESRLLPGALLPNPSLKFICRQVTLRVCGEGGVFTSHYRRDDRISIPVKHQSGRYFAPRDELARLEAAGMVALRYAEGENPNGSVNDIAAVTNREGNVMGLMPHPEHAVDPMLGSTDGAGIFGSMAAWAGGSG